ncbi:MAG: amidohydrolase family protein [Gammaproteobacteria bacterium]
MSGVFDKYPKLKIVIGHMGENIPYALYRLDWMHGKFSFARAKLALTPGEYFRQNFHITTSGVNWVSPKRRNIRRTTTASSRVRRPGPVRRR